MGSEPTSPIKTDGNSKKICRVAASVAKQAKAKSAAAKTLKSKPKPRTFAGARIAGYVDGRVILAPVMRPSRSIKEIRAAVDAVKARRS